MFLAILSSYITYEFAKLRYIGAIRASSIIGILIYILSKQFETLDPVILFGATFVGMCSSNRVNRLELILSTLMYLLALSYLKNHFNGFGGLLGMSSFIGVLAILTLSSIHKKALSIWKAKKMV